MPAQEPRIIIDTRGMFCPVPIIKTSEAMRQIDPGALVELISDDPAIEHDLPAWSKATGHAIESHARNGDDYLYVVRKRVDP